MGLFSKAAKIAAPAMQIGGMVTGQPWLSAAGSALGQYGASKQLERQANETAAQYAERMRQAGQMGMFKPVGVKTLYGESNFEIDPVTGQLKSAGYTASPEVIQQQQRLGQLMGTGLGAAERAAGYLPQYEQAGQQLFGLGQQFLPTGTEGTMTQAEQEYLGKVQQLGRGLTSDLSGTPSADVLEQQSRLQSLAGQITPTSYDPIAAARDYYQEQQDIMQPARQREEQRLASSVFGRGRGGLSVGAEGQPELFALGQARAEQDARLAALSRERARQELQQDIALGTRLGGEAITTGQQGEQYQLGKAAQGIDLLGAALTPEERARQRMFQDIQAGTGLLSQGAGTIGMGYDLMQGSLAPYQSYLQNQSQLEQLAQQPLTLGAELGGRSMSGGQFAGGMAGQSAFNQAQARMSAAKGRYNTMSGLLGNEELMGDIGAGVKKGYDYLGGLFTPGGGIGGGYSGSLEIPGSNQAVQFGQLSAAVQPR